MSFDTEPEGRSGRVQIRVLSPQSQSEKRSILDATVCKDVWDLFHRRTDDVAKLDPTEPTAAACARGDRDGL